MNIQEYIEQQDKELDKLLTEAQKLGKDIARGNGNKAFNTELLKKLHANMGDMREDLTNVMMNKASTSGDMAAIDDFSIKMYDAEKDFEQIISKLEPKEKYTASANSKAPLITGGQLAAIAAVTASALIGLIGIAASLTIVGLPIGIPLTYIGAKLLNKSVNYFSQQNERAGLDIVKPLTHEQKKPFEFVDLTKSNKEEEQSWKKPAATMAGKGYTSEAQQAHIEELRQSITARR